MAKKKENTKQRYRKGGPARLDMREGGRVALGKGGGSSSGSTDKSRREKNKEKRKQRRIDRRNARKSKSGEESGTRESLPAPGDIASDVEVTGGARVDPTTGQVVDASGKPKVSPPQTTGPRGTQNIPGPSGFDTYTAGPGSSPQQTAPGEPGIGSVGVDVNPNAPASESDTGEGDEGGDGNGNGDGNGDGNGNGNGNGDGDGDELTYPEGLPEGGKMAYDVARGERKIAPDAVKVGGYLTNEDGTVATYPTGHPQEGEPIPLTPDMDETTMKALTDAQKAKVGVAKVDLYKKDSKGNIIRDDKGAPVPVSAVSTAGVAKVAKKITDVEASTYDEIERILTSPTVTAQESTFKEEMKAVIDEIVGVKKADGVTIDDEEAASALAKDLQGELSDGAMAKAVSISGANLSRVLRAKKQLRKAGLSEDIITELGDNPDDLEDRLDEFTEAERGVVAGLPEEALVSNQLDNLLTGIENGEVPTWAQPAVAAVNQMMAARGLDSSTVGRDNLFNAIIQSAVPLAQQNAQAIQATFTQTKELESRATIAQGQIDQQTALDHANKTFQMDMANFNEDQTVNLANSKFLQTVELTNASMEQQSAVQEAANLANLDLATLNTRERLAVSNAKSFLQLDLANLNNKQQSEVLTDQMEMQKLLNNQSAENARLQFNAQSENQVNTFMSNLANQIEINNAQRIDATKQFNATQKNAAIARREGIEADVSKLNAQLVTQVNQFNSQQDFERNKWNATNQAMVEQSNVEWRRKSNTINTAAQNQINMQNAMNAFKISGASLSNYWQQLRDEAAYDFKAQENADNRLAQILSTAIANEGEIAKKEYWDSHVDEFKSIYDTWFGGS